MTQVKDVSRTSARAAQNCFGPRLQLLPVRKEQHRIEVSLHRAFEAHAAPTIVQRNAPVKSDDFGSRLFHGRQQRSGLRAEINDRHASLLQLLYQLGHMGQNVSAVVLDT